MWNFEEISLESACDDFFPPNALSKMYKTQSKSHKVLSQAVTVARDNLEAILLPCSYS